jgi:hypothetical protein
MVKDIEERIKVSFSDDDEERLVKYMDWINSSVVNYVQVVRRSASILLLLVAAFELVVGSQKTTISIGSFSISRDSIALVFLPAIVAFLFLQMALDTCKTLRLYNAFSAAFEKWFPKGARNELDLVLDQPQPAYWGAFQADFDKAKMDMLDKREYFTSAVFILVIIIGTLAFEAQAYYVLFPAHISAIAPWAVSLLVTLFCLINGISLFPPFNKSV